MTLKNAYIIDAIRTPFGRYAGGLAPVRADDLGAVPIKALMQRNPSVDWEQVDDVIYGCANQAGEDNRNVGRMSALLAGLPYQVPATTINRFAVNGNLKLTPFTLKQQSKIDPFDDLLRLNLWLNSYSLFIF
ncbi:hypothetical protein QM090_07815 [Acinetobacter baumannii]|nr:hypothetical protein [Acinetobacter baumannii]MDV5174038.1 hypothetical protein [Acinetobacter baumannii]